MSFEELPSRAHVLEELFKRWTPRPETESVGTREAYSRVLAEDVFSLCDKPVFRASRMDGIAVKSSAFTQGTPNTEKWIQGEDYVRADTGDDFPDAFDAVIPIERVELLPQGGVRLNDINDPVTPGMCVSPKGETLSAGALIGRKGKRLNACETAAIAMGAVTEVKVIKRPTAAFIPTGSELVPLGQMVERGHSVEADSIIAEHMLREIGAEPIIYPIVPDDMSRISAALDSALSIADIVIISAGTSKGGEDYSQAILTLRGNMICHGVATAPGRPLAIAIINGKPVINVAGPPLACYNGLDWCVRAVVNAWLGQPPFVRRKVRAKLLAGPVGGGRPGGPGGRPGGGPGGRPPGRPGGPGGSFEFLARYDVKETPEGITAQNAENGLLANAQCYGPKPDENGFVEIEML